MNEQQIAYRIKQELNRGLDLDAGKLTRLKTAREHALAHQRVESRIPVLAWADSAVGKLGGPSSLIPRMLLPMAVLVLCLVALNQCRESQVRRGADRGPAVGRLPRQGIRCMAKALIALALCLCISLPVAAAAPKKPPAWAELTPEQQQILAPLGPDWDKLEPARKRKWIGIAKRYPKMKPDEQARVQRRMQAWAKLTPKERQDARERYKKIKNLPPDKKEGLKQKWEEYNRLPEQERRKLGSTPRKPPTAAPAGAPDAPPAAAAPEEAPAAAGALTPSAPAATQ